jgi:two-component system response regulator VicR
MATIMLVDDEPSIRKLVEDLVTDEGLEFRYASNGYDALDMIAEKAPDLVILDVMMPKIDGFSTCRKIRQTGATMPVIFLSAKSDIVDKSAGFAAGGDDYMTKPFDARELMLHVDAHLRRASMTAAAAAPEAAQSDDVITVGRLTLDLVQHRFTKDGEHVKLTRKEFAIMRTLIQHPGVVFSKDQLIEAGWGKEFVGETTTIAVFMKKLRAKVEDDPTDPRIIETVWGVGYRLDADACQ